MTKVTAECGTCGAMIESSLSDYALTDGEYTFYIISPPSVCQVCGAKNEYYFPPDGTLEKMVSA